MLLKNGLILEDNKLVKKDILIKDGLIKLIEDSIEGEGLDLKNLFITPGFIDVHVHLREPGYEHKETIKSGTLAAAKGGYTHIFTMPNLKPVPSNKEALQRQLNVIDKDALIKVTPYGSISNDLKGTSLANFNEIKDLVCAFTDDGLGIQSNNLMKEAMNAAKEINKIIVAHCEDEEYIVTDNRRAEYEQVKRDIELVREIKGKYHVCHVSTKESLEYIRQAKLEGLNVTCEIAPHHLLLDESMINNNTNFKMNPPLRIKSDVEACIDAIIDGTIDMIATDHAPHTKEEKNVEYNKAPNGVIGLETAFGLMYKNFVETNVITLERLIDLMAINPSKVFGLPSNNLVVGNAADLAVIDLTKEVTIEEKDFVSKSQNSPFIGNAMKGIVELTIVNGNIVYRRRQDV